MTHSAVFSAIDARVDTYIQVWQDICNIESPTACKAGVDAVGAYIISLARARGWSVEVFPQPVSGNVVTVTMNPEAKGTPIALSGHMDTVHDIGSFGTPATRIEDGKIFGPGVTDCKGGIVSSLLAMDALDACGYTDRPIKLFLQSDEENGSRTSEKATIGYICKEAQGCAAFLNGEGYKPETLVIGRKGILRYRFSIKGQAVHSADCANGIGGINAIAEAAHKILALEQYKDRNGITCNCGLIEGGTVANTVPEHCSFVADFRFRTDAERKQVEAIAKEVAETAYLAGATCELTKISYRVAMEPCARNDALVARMNEIFEKVGFSTLTPRLSNGGSDAADVSVAGIPCVDCVGVSGGHIHGLNEFAYLSSLAESAKRHAAIILYL